MQFLQQLENFKTLLQSTEVLIEDLSHETATEQKLVVIRKPRGLLDIFTPYSLNELADTANVNYGRMNKNFNKI